MDDDSFLEDRLEGDICASAGKALVVLVERQRQLYNALKILQ